MEQELSLEPRLDIYNASKDKSKGLPSFELCFEAYFWSWWFERLSQWRQHLKKHHWQGTSQEVLQTKHDFPEVDYSLHLGKTSAATGVLLAHPHLVLTSPAIYV